MKEHQIQLLIEEAIKARDYAYAPYSHFKVGAALLCGDNSIYRGCNVENASYPAGNCAERTAIFKAVSEGKTNFQAIAIVGGKENGKLEYCPPCGICRQVLSEFCEEDFLVILSDNDRDYKQYKLIELLPLQFEL
ncbi:MAG: cytidine deaminase [Lachnospiraceae bacterium]|nr:cytidine deaminase [Lachnospiraceae bacterium]